LSQTKRRPALVLAALSGDDVILCQITSQAKSDEYSISLDSSDFASGGLNLPSHIRPNRLFTADSHVVLYSAGRVRTNKLNETVDAVITILNQL
jgi:mRNA interferase MazF